ncbi:alpha/beta hydrolase family protein [Microlunatus sp. Gsoil 973]|uniref:alpha/beta hydrolase n=1 Tax=Microlunatus sp. Gsoil 973 TaxID=2672569 RepID=UPI0012B45A47|nr:alpha/beta hydrolase family protein [Microlunatus sp. Gsoil 973]QGN32141.1 esterase family protein [Microlunatus sp. Gsoil 973]
MAHLRCDFYSDALGLSTSMTVILPQQTRTQIGMAGAVGSEPPPVLYLLHGLSDDDTTWLRRTSVERYVAPLGMAVIMPQVHRSFYHDQAYGGAYWTFLSEELPELVGQFFRLSDRREDTFVAGLSMGGYGAMRWALTYPDRFAAAASFSGAVNITGIRTNRVRPDDPRLSERIFGSDPVPESADLFHLLGTVDRDHSPSLYVSCGTEDRLIEDNRSYVTAIEEAGLPLRTSFVPGEHEWGLWDLEIQSFLAGLPIRGLDDRG